MSLSFLPYMLGFLAVITLVVGVHELGHYLVGRWVGVKIERFSIGIGTELLGYTDRRGCRWRFAAIPIGGYVKFAGDENAASVPTQAQADKLAELPHDPDMLQFRPTWQRAAVIAAGPFASLALAVVIFGGLSMVYGVHSSQPLVGDVVEGSPAAAAGFKGGDVVKSINGREISSFEDIPRSVTVAGGAEMLFVVQRAGSDVRLTVKPRRERLFIGIPLVETAERTGLSVGAIDGSPAAAAGLKTGDLVTTINGAVVRSFGDVPRFVKTTGEAEIVFDVVRAGASSAITFKPRIRDDEIQQSGSIWRLGLKGAAPDQMRFKTERVGPLGALAFGVKQTAFIAAATGSYVRDMFNGLMSPEQIGGVVRMIDVSGKVAKRNAPDLIQLAALISASVGLMNLLPFLPLDGGHLVNHAYEALRGRPMSPRSQEMQALFGLSFVAAMMVLAFYNDLSILQRWMFG